MAASTLAVTPLKWLAVGGVALTLTCGAAYAKSTFSSVSPKVGQGAGIGVGSAPLIIKGFTQGFSDMNPGATTPGAPAAPVSPTNPQAALLTR